MNIERGLAIQDDDKMIAVGGDLIAIPVIRLEGVLASMHLNSIDRTKFL